MRGKGLLDIDFTGGSSVHILFAEGKARPIAEVRAKVADLPDVTVVSIGAPAEGGSDYYEFKIDTSERDKAAVQRRLVELFGPDLRRNRVQIGELAQIEAAPPAQAPPAQAPPSATEPAKGPAPKQGARRQTLPPETLVALAQDAAPPATEKAEQSPPAAEKPAAEPAPAEPQAGESPAPPAAGEQPGAAAPADQPAATAPGEFPATTESKGEPSAAGPTAPAPSAPTTGSPAPGATALPTAGAEAAAPAAVDPFAGGTRVKLSFSEAINHESLAERIREAFRQVGQPEVTFRLLSPGYVEGSNTPFKEWTVELAGPAELARGVLAAVQERLAAEPVFPSSSAIGQKVAGDTQLQAAYALLISLVGIIVYVWFRFSYLIWGVASVVALVHDVLIMLAAIALSAYMAPYLGFLLVDPVKISLTIVAAFLTIIGFSINDTIVIFDRMREIKGKSPDLTPKMVNDAVNQTLSRSIITSLTVLIVVVILYIWGGEAMHGFAFSLLVGVISGSYSTIFIAAPLVLWMAKRPGAAARGPARVAAAGQPQAIR
jgi:SecD/SecF fusion protein